MNKFLVTGAIGGGAVEAVNQIPPVNNAVEIGKLVVQAIIGLFTILNMRKQYKKDKETQSK